MLKKIISIAKAIWGWLQIIGTIIIVGVVFLVTKRKVTTIALDKVQKDKEQEAREKYEEMSDGDVVDSLVNANDIRNTARAGPGTTYGNGAIRSDRPESLLSRLIRSGVRRADVPRGKRSN